MPCQLVQYIRDELFKDYSEDRQPLEAVWLKNYQNFNSVSTGHWKIGEGEGWRSKTFIPLTRTKVVFAWSIVIDVFLQGGKVPFNLIPSPWDEVLFEEFPAQMQQQILDSIDDMSGLIHQQFTDCNADRQFMKCIMSSAIFGECYAKEYVQDVVRRGYEKIDLSGGRSATGNKYIRFKPYEIVTDSPAWEYVSVWDMFRDLETDDIQAGTGIIHRQFISPYNLRQRIDKALYIPEAIEKVIKESSSASGSGVATPGTGGTHPSMAAIKRRRNTICELEFWGRVPTKIVEEFEKDYGIGDAMSVSNINDVEIDGNEVEIVANVANGEVIRFARTVPNERPFYRAVWELMLDEAGGRSVATNVEEIQTSLTGMVRLFEDNKKLSANVMAAVKERYLPDWDGEFVPGKKLLLSDECDDAGKALMQVVIQDVGETLLNGIRLMERYGDEASMLPKLLQGELAEKKQPDTAYEMSRLIENAGKYLGGVVKNHDEGLIEPIVTSFYRYNMLDPDVKRGKGNYLAKAAGFTSFQDRVVRLQKIMQGINLVTAIPELAKEVRLRTLLEEVFRALDLNASMILKTPEEKEADMQMAMQMQQAQQSQAEEAVDRQRMKEAVLEEKQKDAEHERKKDIEVIKFKGKHLLALDDIAAGKGGVG